MKKYAIYGDDDQQRLNEIFEDEENIQYLVDQANKKTMNDRKKEASKKKVLDTTINNEKPGEVNDIEQGNPVDKKQPTKNKENKKENKKEKDPKIKKKLVVIVVLLILIVIAISTVLTLFGDQTKELYNQTFNKNEVNQTEKIDITSNDNSNIDKSEYNFSDIVRVSQEINSHLQEYYADIQSIIVESKKGSPETAIQTLKAKVEEDYTKFTTFEPYFSLYEGGSSFYKSLSERYDNIRGLIVSISTVSDNDMMYALIKNSIDVENQLIIKGKNELINFFEANNVEYKDKDTSVVFEVK